eukprot:15463248-Alexandrium_andersonii.AAC.1
MDLGLAVIEAPGSRSCAMAVPRAVSSVLASVKPMRWHFGARRALADKSKQKRACPRNVRKDPSS